MNESRAQKYAAGWFDSRGRLKFNTENKPSGWVFHPKLSLPYRCDKQVDFFEDISKHVGFDFRQRKTIEIYKDEDVASFINWVYDELVRNKGIVEYFLEVYLDDQKYYTETEFESHLATIEELSPKNWSGDSIHSYEDFETTDVPTVLSHTPEYNYSPPYIAAWFDNRMVFSLQVSESNNSIGYIANPRIDVSTKYIYYTTADLLELWLADNEVNYTAQAQKTKFSIEITEENDILWLLNELGPYCIARQDDIITFLEEVGPYIDPHTSVSQYDSDTDFLRFVRGMYNAKKTESDRGNEIRKYTPEYFKNKLNIDN